MNNRRTCKCGVPINGPTAFCDDCSVPTDFCAVEHCQRRGSPQVCLYDESYHGHGMIHYDCTRAEQTDHGLLFRQGRWRMICAEHYDILRGALRATEQAVRS